MGAGLLAVRQWTDAAGFQRAGNPSTMSLADIDGDGRADLCMVGPRVVPAPGGGTTVLNELYCAVSHSSALPSFDTAQRRTDVSGIRDRVASGRLDSARRRFCYVPMAGPGVYCTNRW